MYGLGRCPNKGGFFWYKTVENKTGLRKTVRSREVSGLRRVSGPEVSVYMAYEFVYIMYLTCGGYCVCRLLDYIKSLFESG